MSCWMKTGTKTPQPESIGRKRDGITMNGSWNKVQVGMNLHDEQVWREKKNSPLEEISGRTKNQLKMLELAELIKKKDLFLSAGKTFTITTA